MQITKNFLSFLCAYVYPFLHLCHMLIQGEQTLTADTMTTKIRVVWEVIIITMVWDHIYTKTAFALTLLKQNHQAQRKYPNIIMLLP